MKDANSDFRDFRDAVIGLRDALLEPLEPVALWILDRITPPVDLLLRTIKRWVRTILGWE